MTSPRLGPGLGPAAGHPPVSSYRRKTHRWVRACDESVPTRCAAAVSARRGARVRSAAYPGVRRARLRRSRRKSVDISSRRGRYGGRVDEAHAVLTRLRRIEALERENALPATLLAELRELVLEAERWLAAEGWLEREPDEHARAVDALDRCRAALAEAAAPVATR